MCLEYEARDNTKDVDAIFQHKKIVYKLAKEISEELRGQIDINPDWLNDAVKGYLSSKKHIKDEFSIILDFPNLKVYSPAPEYILAMKCISFRLTEESQDKEDIKFLIKKLNLSISEDVLEIVKEYYPEKQIPVKFQYGIDEIFQELRNKEQRLD